MLKMNCVHSQPHLLESYLTDALSSIYKCVLSSGRRESALLVDGGEPLVVLRTHTQQILLAYVAVLQEIALQHDDQVWMLLLWDTSRG